MRALFPTIAAPVVAVLFSFSGLTRAETSPVSIRVEQANKSDMNQKDRIVRQHSRTLIVFLTNNSGEPLNLKVKHIVFGRNMLDHDYITAGEGEKMVALKPHGSERVAAPEVKTTSSEQHFDAKTKKKVDPSGATIVGAGVQVLQGDKLVAEWYDPASLKESWGKTAKPTPVPVKK